MKASVAAQRLGIGFYLIAVSLLLGACNTTEATLHTTKDFFSSTSPHDLFTGDGMVVKEQKINLFAGVNYENLRQEAAAGGGQYVSALASLYGIPVAKEQAFGEVLQRKHSDLFAAGLEEDRTAYLKMVNALNHELVAASLLP